VTLYANRNGPHLFLAYYISVDISMASAGFHNPQSCETIPFNRVIGNSYPHPDTVILYGYLFRIDPLKGMVSQDCGDLMMIMIDHAPLLFPDPKISLKFN
jgi:hypothetical protein